MREPRLFRVRVGATILGMRRSGRSERTWAKWRGLVAEQERSGLSVQRFCIDRGLASSSLFAWRRKVRLAEAARASRPGGTARRRLAPGGTARSRMAPSGATPGRRPAFVEATIASEGASAPGRHRPDRAAKEDWHRGGARGAGNAGDADVAGGAGGVAVELACGRRIIVQRGFDAHLLRAVIETLESIDACGGWADEAMERLGGEAES